MPKKELNIDKNAFKLYHKVKDYCHYTGYHVYCYVEMPEKDNKVLK